MPNITCVRCGQTRDQMSFQPFQSDLGRRLFNEICAVCWGQWLGQQQALINHYALNLREPKAKEFLLQQMDEFLFGLPAPGND